MGLPGMKAADIAAGCMRRGSFPFVAKDEEGSAELQ